MNKSKQIPNFKTEAEERQFWEKHDSTDYLDWKQAKAVMLPNLKPSTKTISIRLPEGLLDSIKVEANKLDMPYQSLIKVWLADHVGSSCITSLNTQFLFSFRYPPKPSKPTRHIA